MQQKTYQVRLLHTEGEYLHLAYENWTTKIKNDLIEINQLEVIDNEVELNSGFFECWFAKNIEAELARRVDCYKKHIPLIWANRELIIKEPKYYNVETPMSFLYGSVHNPYKTSHRNYYIPFTLGCLLQLWMNEDVFSAQCDTCSSQAVIYTIGHTITGKPWGNSICLKCGKSGTYRIHAPFDQINEILKKREKMIPISEHPMSFEELVEVIE